EVIELRCQLAFGYQLKKEFDLLLIRRRHNRIRALRAFLRALHPKSRILSGRELEFAAGVDADHPQIGGKIDTLGDLRVIKLVVGCWHGEALAFAVCCSRSLQEFGW